MPRAGLYYLTPILTLLSRASASSLPGRGAPLKRVPNPVTGPPDTQPQNALVVPRHKAVELPPPGGHRVSKTETDPVAAHTVRGGTMAVGIVGAQSVSLLVARVESLKG